MAAPTYDSATIGTTDAGGAWGSSSFVAVGVGDLLILHVFQDGATSGAVGVSTFVGVENLAGTDNQMDYLGEFPVGNPTAGYSHLWIGRALSTTGGGVNSGTNSTSEDLYIRTYSFKNVSTGTTLATVIENGTAGSTANGVGTSNTASDTAVTTLGADRLALNFVAVNDDDAISAFTGETGGDWTLAVAPYADAGGTDGAIGLQIATISAAATIDGGTENHVDSDAWGVVGFALIGTTVAPPAVPFVPQFRFLEDA